jgi:hypothetical protein
MIPVLPERREQGNKNRSNPPGLPDKRVAIDPTGRAGNAQDAERGRKRSEMSNLTTRLDKTAYKYLILMRRESPT